MDQDYLDKCHAGLQFSLQIICTITPRNSSISSIRVSDNNIYVDHEFYEARLKTPSIKRSLGQYLRPNISFPTLELVINNADGSLNDYLGGGRYAGNLNGAAVTVKIGHGESLDNYHQLFSGRVKREKGIKRTDESLKLTVRDNAEDINVDFPLKVFTKEDFPELSDDRVGKIIPPIYGDFTVWQERPIVPGIVVNSTHEGDNPAQVVVSLNQLLSLDTSNIWLKRGDKTYLIAASDVAVSHSKNTFTVRQNGDTRLEDPDTEPKPYQLEESDQFLVSVKGPYDGPIGIAKELLRGSGLTLDLDESWDSARDTVKSRIYIYQQKPLITYVLSLLETARAEAFFTANGKLKLASILLSDGQTGEDRPLDDFDFEKGKLAPSESDKPTNRLLTYFDFSPDKAKTTAVTGFFENVPAVEMAGHVTSGLELPYLYREDDAKDLAFEILRTTGSGREYVSANLSLRSLFLELGDWVNVTVSDGSVEFDQVPMRVVEVGFSNYRIPVKLCSYQQCPFPGYEPSHPVTGGWLADIRESDINDTYVTINREEAV